MLISLRASGLATHLPLIYTVIFILVILVAALVRKEVRSFVKGQEGEARVSSVLAKLPNNFYSLHDFTTDKRGNIDFIVVGPNGIWTIEVKNCKGGEITFNYGLLCRNGQFLEGIDLKQAYAEKMELKNYLHQHLGLLLPIHSALVFANPKVTMRFGFREINGVYVIGIKWLIKLLQEQNIADRLPPELCLSVGNEVKKYLSII